MRFAETAFFAVWIVLAAILPGCGWLTGSRVGQNEVPVTPPSQSASSNPASQADATVPAKPQAEDGSQERGQAAAESPTPLVPLVDDAASDQSGPSSRPKLDPTTPESATGQPVVVAASMLQVNDHFITVRDVLQSVNAELAALPRDTSEAAFRNKATAVIDRETRNQVTRSLVLAEAKRRLPEQLRERIDAEVEQVRKDMIAHADGSETRLRRLLAQKGTTLKDVLEDHRQRLLIRTYLQATFMSSISINRSKLWDYYNSHRADFTTPRRVQMQIIAAPFDAFLPKDVRQPSEQQRNAAKAEARKLINQAMTAVLGGEEFGKVARETSRGLKADRDGVWPMMPAGSFREEKVEQAAFALAEGKVSEIVETETGFYVVKAMGVENGKVVSFEDAQERIDNILREMQYRKLVDAYFKQLLEKATIIQREEFTRLAVDRAVAKHRGEQR